MNAKPVLLLLGLSLASMAADARAPNVVMQDRRT
jgi:hypothetical protein